MKKEYVNLKVQVIEVQLSDCIAGSAPTSKVLGGVSVNHEVGVQGNGVVRFGGWAQKK